MQIEFVIETAKQSGPDVAIATLETIDSAQGVNVLRPARRPTGGLHFPSWQEGDEIRRFANTPEAFLDVTQVGLIVRAQLYGDSPEGIEGEDVHPHGNRFTHHKRGIGPCGSNLRA